MGQAKEHGASPPELSPSQIVACLDDSTKIAFVSGQDFWSTKPLTTFGVEPITMADGPHGLRKQEDKGDHLGLGASVPATCFPPAVTMASTWDRELIERVGVALGQEASDRGVDVVLGPGLNIKRHPAGGRNFEYFSEDPHLSGKMAAALVRGIQSQGVAACAKHFAVNNQEFDRMRVDMIVDERTLREVYLAGFEIVVREASPWMVMASYNRINGDHADCASWLLTDILRGEWGFDGVVVSDWFATTDRARAIGAGTDLEMPYSHEAWAREIAAALSDGSLSHRALDQACERIIDLERRVRRGRSRITPRSETASAPALQRHHQLARQVAAAGTVLLTNDGILPLPEDVRLGVIGAFAAEPRYQGSGSSQVVPTQLDTFLDAVRMRLGADRVSYAPAYDATTGLLLADGLDDAVNVASPCDVAVVLVGLPPTDETEGRDRSRLALPSGHDRLVETVAAANDRCVVVLQNGSVVDLPWVDQPAAVVEAWLGGQAGGSALVDVLTGDVEPGGRLAETFPGQLDHLPAHKNFDRAHTQDRFAETHHIGYRFFHTFGVEPRFAFGHGLGYTTWGWGRPTVTPTDETITLEIPVTNTGPRHGAQILQVYLAKPDSVIPRPERVLAGFVRVDAAPDETVTGRVVLDERAFQTWDIATKRWVTEGGRWLAEIGESSAAIHSRIELDIASDDELARQPKPAAAVHTDAEFAAVLGRELPDPDPLVPFHRDSTIDDLQHTLLGRLARRSALMGLHLKVPVGPDDPQMAAHVEELALETPLRVVGINAAGKWGLPAIDLMIKILNTASRNR